MFRTVKLLNKSRVQENFSDFRNVTGWWEVGVRITSSKGMFFVLRKIDCKKKRDMKRRRNLDRGFGKFASNTYTRCHSTRKIEIIIIRGRYTDKLFQNGGFNLHFLSMRSRIQIPPTSSSFCHTIERRVLRMPSI